MMNTQEAAANLQEELEAKLAPAGWSIKATVGNFAPRFSLVFEHPLTSDFIVSLDSEKDFRATLDRFLSNPEFAAIATAPAVMPHAALVRALRENAKGCNWPDSVLDRLGLILETHGLLTSEEAEWLERAGAAWAARVSS